MAKKENKTNAMRILETLKISYEMCTYECDDFIDGVHLAEMLSLPYEKVYKTLVTVGKSKNHYVFVIPVADEIDFKKAAKVVGEKSLEMLPLKDLTAVTGYIRGGYGVRSVGGRGNPCFGIAQRVYKPSAVEIKYFGYQ